MRGVFVFTGGEKEVGMLIDPWRIGCDVVGYIVEDELDAACSELLPCDGQGCVPAEVRIDDVLAHAVGRADVVVRREIGQGTLEVCEECAVMVGDGDARRAALPHTHKPHGVEVKRGDAVPCGVWHGGEIDGLVMQQG